MYRKTKNGSRNQVCGIGDKITEKYNLRETKIGPRNREFRETEGSRNRAYPVLYPKHVVG